MLTKKTVAVNMNLSPLIIEKSLENLIYINILNVESTFLRKIFLKKRKIF